MRNLPPREWPENAPIRGAAAIWDFYVEAVKIWDDGSFGWGGLIDEGTDFTRLTCASTTGS